MPFDNMALKTSEPIVNLLNPKALRHFLLVLLAIGLVGLMLTHKYATQHQHDQWQNKLQTQASQVAQEIDYELAKFEKIPNCSAMTQDYSQRSKRVNRQNPSIYCSLIG